MKTRRHLYRLFNIAALLSMLFSMAQPILAAQMLPEAQPAIAATLPKAPSELAGNWPKPQWPDHELSTPFLDPASLALEQALGDSIDADWFTGGRPTGLEPLTPNPFSPVDVSSPVVGRPAWPDSPKLEPTLPQSAIPQPEPADALAELNLDLPIPTDLNSLADEAEVQELEDEGNGFEQASNPETNAGTVPTPAPQVAQKQLKSLPLLVDITPITITETGFDTPVVTTTIGTPVVWTNGASEIKRIKIGDPGLIVFLPLIFKTTNGSAPTNNPSTPSTGESRDILPGGKFSHVFTQTGEYPYYLVNSPVVTGLIIVQPATSFSLTVSPPAQTITQGQTITYSYFLTSVNDFDQAVTLSLNAAEGITGLFAPNPVTPTASGLLTLTTVATTSIGAYPLVITAQGGSISQTQVIMAMVVSGSISVTTVITPGVGGRLEEPGGVKINFSPNSVQQQTQAQYLPLNGALNLPPGLAAVGPAFSVTAWEKSSGDPVTRFPHQVTMISASGVPSDDTYISAYPIITPSIIITVPYNEANIPQGMEEHSLSLYARRDASQPWMQIPSAVYPEQNRIMAEVDHLTDFIPVGVIINPGDPITPHLHLVLDPDDDVGHATWSGTGTVREITYNMALAQQLKQKFETDICWVDIRLTRNSTDERFVSRSLRADIANGFNAEMFVTLAFNAFTGSPWGLESNGGVVGWARNGQPDDDALVNEFYNRIQEYTGRPHRRPVQHPPIYGEFNSLPGSMTYAHIETLFMDHNFDWPVIDTKFEYVVDAAYAALRTQLAAKGLVCATDDPTNPNNPLGLPAPPSAAELQRLHDLGLWNYQKYGADPVSFSTGNYIYQNTLFQMPGPGGHDVDFTLTYNAQDDRDSLFGFGWSFPYHAYTQVYSDSSVSVVLHDGRTYHYTWNGSEHVAPAGVFETLTQTPAGWEWTRPDGTVLTFEELQRGLGILTEWRDRRGNSLTFEHDLSGAVITPTAQISGLLQHPPLTAMTDATGRTIMFESDAGNHITRLTLPDGREFQFAYSNGDMIELTDPNGGTRRYQYDDQHRITHHFDPEGIMYLENIYDDEDRVIEQVDASGSHMIIDYDTASRVTTFTDNLGHETRYFYDELNRVTAVEDALGQTEHFVYDDDYNLTAYTDKRGNTWTYTYDRGNLLSETDPLGHLTTYTYNDANDLLSMTDQGRPGNTPRTTTYDYDDDGNLLQINQSDGTSLLFTYDDQGQPLTATDGNGHTTHYAYNDQGDLMTVTDPLGHITRYEYDEMGRQIRMIDANNHVASFEYDGNDNIIRVIDPKGAVSSFEYDGNDNLVRLVDRLGRVTTYEYDENLKLVAETDSEGNRTSYDYDRMYNRISQTDPLGRVTLYRYDALYRLKETEDALGGLSRFEYDPNGNLIRLIDPLGRATRYEYDTLNRLVAEIDALGGRKAYEYDAVDRLRRETNPRGAVTEYEYDLLDRPTLIRDALGGEWLTAYDGASNTTRSVDANGAVTLFRYDEANRLVEKEDALGNVTQYAYDNVGNLSELIDALGRVTQYGYDENDYLTTITDALGGLTTSTYDAEDNLVATADQNGRVTRYEYDDLDRVMRMIENYDPGAALATDVNVTTAYEYDAVGNLLRLIDANGNATTYEYDDLNRLARETDAEAQVTTYEYDAVGNLRRQVNPRGYATRYSYDDLNRLETMTDAEDNTWRYSYDPAGNVIDTFDPLGVVTHQEYDLLDRLTTRILNYVSGGAATSDQNVTTRFEYDPVGNLRFVHDPRGSYITEHRYDALNRRILTIDAEGGETQFVYDAVDNLTSLVDANDHATTFVYDALNRRTSLTNAEGYSLQFQYDPAGNLLTLTDARGNPTRFTYDGMYRVILRLDALNGEWRYQYDAMGNILREIDANGHANNSYSYDKIYRLLTSTDAEGFVTAYTYDPNGNQLTMRDGNDHIITYTYDALDRLASMTNAENETTQYRYDPLGNQTQLIEADGIVTLYSYDPLYRLVTVTQNHRPGQAENADTNVDTHYSYDEVGNLLSILDTEAHETHFSYDGLNRLIQEVDAEGNTWDYAYDPVGNRTVRIDANRHRTDYSYYPDDQLQRIEYHDGTFVAYTYDENNNRLTTTNQLGTTTWSYDALNRMTGQTDALGRHLGYAYDPVGNRTGLTYADGRTVTYTYYDNNWLATVIDPEGNVTTYDRDGVGLVTRAFNPNNTIAEAAYDKTNRLLRIDSRQADSQDVINAFSYSYDEVGNRVEMVAEYGWRNPRVVSSSYTYDGLRRLIRDEDSGGHWTEYQFDRVGNRLTLRTNDDSTSSRPFDEQTLTYSYNAINQLLTIVGDTHPGSAGLKRTDNTAQALHAFHHEVEAQQGKHITSTAANNLLSMADALLADLYDNPAPKVNEVTAAVDALRGQVSAYRDSGAIDNDGIENSLLAKLNKADGANIGTSGELQVTTFRYDANGNRINKEFPGPQGPKIQGTDYSYDPENRLVTAQDYQMNTNGNRVDRAVTHLTYDGEGRRLVKAYDPKTGGGGVKRTEYVFDGLDPVAEYRIGTPQYDNFYRGDSGRIVAMQHFPSGSAGQMFWFHYDGLGSTTGLTKQNGQSTHNYRYEPYGQIELPPGNFTGPHNHYTFTGQELDENMAVYEFYARAYDYGTGTWLQQDLHRGWLNIPQSLHRYAYAYTNPTTYYDIYGYCAFGFSCPGFIKDTVNNVKKGWQSTPDWVKQGASLGAGFIPVVGDVTDAYAAITGRDMITGEKLSLLDRGLSVIGLLPIPGVTGSALRAAKNLLPRVPDALKVTQKVVIKAPNVLLNTLPKPPKALQKLLRPIYDNRRFKTISHEIWQQKGGANGKHLHHWLFPQRWKWIPQGIRNARFNLLELPANLNTWAGRGSLRELKEWAIRRGILGLLHTEVRTIEFAIQQALNSGIWRYNSSSSEFSKSLTNFLSGLPYNYGPSVRKSY